MSEKSQIVDQQQRQAAIDPAHSFIVQAPAGSGKTELLIQRVLALLGTVERPQQVLAITFTRKAANEMANRLLEALAAAQGECPVEAHKQLTWTLARKVLDQDRQKGWNLLENPHLLAIQTIDSLNAALVRMMPWLSRLGGLPSMTEDGDRLYLQASENLLERLGSEQPGADHLARLLAHLDNRVDRLQEMLTGLLKKRDQWLRHLVGIRGADPRTLLESSLGELVTGCLEDLASLLPAPLHSDVLFCANYAAGNLAGQGDRPLLRLSGLTAVPGADSEALLLWQGVADLLLTSTGELRKPGGVTKTCGFPTGAEGQAAKQRMQSLLEGLAETPEFVRQLARSRQLPAAEYSPDQWAILDALVNLLPILVMELWQVFRSEGQADFAEIAMKALSSLGEADDPSDLLLKLDNSIQHILVDEFQDTNLLQFRLLQTLTAGWERGDGRTLFLVGDPMQSIYRFREAEVGLFLRCFEGLFGEGRLELIPLQLRTNFRSQQGIVDWVNTSFAQIFPASADEASGAVPLSEAVAKHDPLPGPACRVYPMIGRDDRAEADAVVELIAAERAADPDQTIAVLVRSRTHLPAILQRLRERGLAYQAQDIDLLGEQPVVLDLLALTRALLHRADRLSWLSVLRAPWAGLTLEDLHTLVDGAPKTTIPSLLQKPGRQQSLSAEGQERMGRVWPILQRSLQRRGRVGLRQLVEGCWLALGGPSCYNAEGVENARRVFDLIESLEQGGELPDMDQLVTRLEKLYAAPDSNADGKLQISTLHRAKGLEYDQVILPGLGRMPRREDTPLLRWIEHPKFGLLLAPIAPRDGSDQDPIYRFIGKLDEDKQAFEVGRMLYVAATRAKRRLHLFGHARAGSKGDLRPESGSLLELLWPLVSEEFVGRAVAPVVVQTRRVLSLYRLPLAWRAPQLVTATLPATTATETASGRAKGTTHLPPWQSQVQRYIGTVVHALLEQIGRQGVVFWEDLPLGQRTTMVGRHLGLLGVPMTDQATACDKVMAAIDQMLASEKGLWLLASHHDDGFERALSGEVGGVLTHAVIDRSFIDEAGTRWVVDYKTSQPQAGESLKEFLQAELGRYQKQLDTYQALYRALDPEREVRGALYFPLINAWCEIQDAPMSIRQAS